MGRFGESQERTKKLSESRVKKNLTTKKEPMITRSIRMTERDIKLLEEYFQKDERTFTQGIRMVLKDFMEKEDLV